jgi:hypothetical protein
MECGKVRSPGCAVFYFVLDPLTPEKPSHARVRTYYVVTHVDSYVEAYYYLARHFSAPSPSLDEAIQRWHALYTRVFGTVDIESFRKSLLSVPVQHFQLCATEEAARERATECATTDTMVNVNTSSAQQQQQQSRAQGNQSRRISPPRHRESSGVSFSGMPDASAIPAGASRMNVTEPTAHTGPRAANRSTADQTVRGLFSEHHSQVERNRILQQQSHAHNDESSSTAAPAGGQQHQQQQPSRANLNASGFLTGAPVYREDAKVELHRLRAEHNDVSNAPATMDYSRAKVNALSDAERAALTYQLAEARKEATHEKAVAKEASERLRTLSRSLEERVDALVQSHEATLRDRTADEHKRLSQIEEEFLEREKAMQKEYEKAIFDRDRKLARAVSKVKAFESHLEDALTRVDEQKAKMQEATMKLAEATNERQALEEDNRRLQRQTHSLELQVEDANRSCSHAEDAQRKAENDAAELKIEVVRLRREMQRYSQFSHSLHRELQQLDDSAITAAELLRRRVAATRSGSVGSESDLPLPGRPSGTY